MAYVDGDILRLTSVSTYLGNAALNVWWYSVAPSMPVGYTDDQITAAFVGQVLEPIAGIQVDDVIYNLLRIENLTQNTDPVEKSLTLTGTVTSEPEPGFMAYEVKLLRTTKVTRHGRKSFVGVTENAIVNGTLSLSTEQVEDMETACSTNIVDGVIAGNPIVLLPIIVGRVKTTVGGKTYYVPDLTKINPIKGAVVQRVSTQNSRKPGRGS